ncbi:MAG: hypothetical protein LAO78_24495 [Acidobacteriia bacterium]|nr:hypothetical protein [Terriglobia bacterium]
MYALLVLVSCFLLQTPSPTAKPEKPIVKNSKATIKADHSTKAAPVVQPKVAAGSQVSQPTATQQQTAHEVETDKGAYRVKVVSQPFDSLYLIYVIVTTIAAFVAWRALVAIKTQGHWMERQLAEMESARVQTVDEMKSAGEQTKDMVNQLKIQIGHLATLAAAAQKSANAAELTAIRFTQIEGARIVVTVEWLPGGGRFYGSGTNGLTTGLPIAVKCKNEGKSIGWIREIRLTAEIFHNAIPPNPSFEIDILYHGIQAIAPNDHFKKDESITLFGQDGVGQWIVIWGLVKYSDIFSDNRETTFGYLITLDGKLERISLPAYNKHT